MIAHAISFFIEKVCRDSNKKLKNVQKLFPETQASDLGSLLEALGASWDVLRSS